MVAPQPRRAAGPVPGHFTRRSSRLRFARFAVVRVVLVALLAGVLLAADRGQPGLGNPSVPAEVGWPVRAAFYYPWFPETESWATRYTPALGKYDSSNPHVLATHVAQA